MMIEEYATTLGGELAYLYQYYPNTGILDCHYGVITSLKFKDTDNVCFYRYPNTKPLGDRRYVEVLTTEGIILAWHDHYDVWLTDCDDERAKSLISEYLINHPRCKRKSSNRGHLDRLKRACVTSID